MTQRDADGLAFVRKYTGWLTISKLLAELLEGICANELGDERHWHRHIVLEGGWRTRMAQVYTPKLVNAILIALKKHLQ